MLRFQASVLSNQAIAEACFRLEFRVPPNQTGPRPGQFLTIKVGEGIAPLLRRPFAYAAHDASSGVSSVIYERRGNATRILGSYREGDELDVLGPLGNSFAPPAAGRRPVLVAGGIGIGPILFLYNDLLSQGHQPLLFVGGRSKARLPLAALPEGAIVCSDDGSVGRPGTVLQALQASAEFDPAAAELYLCGPHGMMKACARAYQDALPCWVSMEQTMACAVGACMGCVVKIHHEKKYARVCAEGPVFAASLVDWA